MSGQMSDKLAPESSCSCSSNSFKIVETYEKNIGMITPAVLEILSSYDELEEDLICEAIKIATLQNKRNCKYVQGILNNWVRKGYKKYSDLQEDKNDKQENTSAKTKVKNNNYEKRQYDDDFINQFYV